MHLECYVLQTHGISEVCVVVESSEDLDSHLGLPVTHCVALGKPQALSGSQPPQRRISGKVPRSSGVLVDV